MLWEEDVVFEESTVKLVYEKCQGSIGTVEMRFFSVLYRLLILLRASIVPFCIACYRGQVFYHVEALYTEDCHGLDKADSMQVIASVMQRIYSVYTR